MACDFATMFRLGAFQVQLGMICDELERYTPRPDTISRRERILWSRARGALRAASTHIENITEAFLPPAESATTIARRDRNLAELKKRRTAGGRTHG
jgi:hypothetical protein